MPQRGPSTLRRRFDETADQTRSTADLEVACRDGRPTDPQTVDDTVGTTATDIMLIGYRLDTETHKEVEALRAFVTSLVESGADTREGDDISPLLAQWHAAVQDDLSQYQQEVVETAAVERAYTSFRLEEATERSVGRTST